MAEVQRSRLFGQVPGRNKLKAGSRLLVSPFPEIKFHPVLLRGAVKLVGSRRPVGKVGETQGVFPGCPKAAANLRAWPRSQAPPYAGRHQELRSIDRNTAGVRSSGSVREVQQKPKADGHGMRVIGQSR